jgi:hypothetical protein
MVHFQMNGKADGKKDGDENENEAIGHLLSCARSYSLGGRNECIHH